MIVVVALISLVACNGAKLTQENFDKITCATLNMETFEYENGMTLQQVKDILGDPSDSTSTTIMGVTSTTYVWGNSNKNITVVFVNGQATAKTQVGLK